MKIFGYEIVKSSKYDMLVSKCAELSSKCVSQQEDFKKICKIYEDTILDLNKKIESKSKRKTKSTK